MTFANGENVRPYLVNKSETLKGGLDVASIDRLRSFAPEQGPLPAPKPKPTFPSLNGEETCACDLQLMRRDAGHLWPLLLPANQSARRWRVTIRKLLELLRPYAEGAEDGAECEVQIDGEQQELVIDCGSDIHRYRLDGKRASGYPWTAGR